MNRLSSLLFIVLASALGIISAGGCSVASALGQPAYVEFKDFKLGESRMQVAEIIGPPKSSAQQPPESYLIDYHEFRSGTPGVTRLRVVGYVAGDVFTAGLAEVVFWPVELALLKARDFKAHFSYDAQQHLNGYRIVGDDGKVQQEDGIIPQ